MAKQVKTKLALNPAPFRHPSPVVGSLLQKARAMEKKGVKVYKGNIGDAAVRYPPSRKVIDAGISLLGDLSHFRYGDTKGLHTLREKIAEIEKVSADDVIIGNGASELMQMLAVAFAGKKANILLPSPCFFPYEVWSDFLNMHGVNLEPRMYACDIGTSWQLDIYDLGSKIDANTRAIVLINPNNPTGWVADDKFLYILARMVEDVNSACAKKGIPPITLISDEVYRDVVFEGHTKSMRDVVDVRKTNLVVINSSSKADRLSGLRVGYAAVSGPNKAEIVESLFNQAGNRLAPNSLGQLFYLKSLELAHPGVEEMKSSLRRASEIVCGELARSNKIKFARPKAGFYLFGKVEGGKWRSSEEFCEELLEKKQVLLSPGTDFIGAIKHTKLKGIFFRLVYLLPDDELREMARKIVEFVG